MSLRQNDSEAFFNRIPWCSRLLLTPNQRIQPPPSRNPKRSTGEDSLFAETLQSARTITAALALYPRPAPTDAHIASLSMLLCLGDALNGWPTILHGGIVATIIDEVMGTLLVLDADRAHMRLVATGHAGGEQAEEVGAHTAELKVRYLAPVRTPGVVLVRTRVVKREGRKIWMGAVVAQKMGQEAELDGRMVECAVGEALMIVPRGVKL